MDLSKCVSTLSQRGNALFGLNLLTKESDALMQTPSQCEQCVGLNTLSLILL